MNTSPTTGAKLENKNIIPNLSLRSIIRSFAEAEGHTLSVSEKGKHVLVDSTRRSYSPAPVASGTWC